MLDDIDAGEEASQESEASYGEMWQDWFIGGRGWIGRGGGNPASQKAEGGQGEKPLAGLERAGLEGRKCPWPRSQKGELSGPCRGHFLGHWRPSQNFQNIRF